MNAHLKRWLTAFIAVPLLIVIIGYGSESIFALFIAAVITAGVIEYNTMVFEKDRRTERGLTVIIALLIAVSAVSGGRSLMMATVTLSIPAVLAMRLLRTDGGGSSLKDTANIFFGVLFIAVTMSHFILIRMDERGIVWIFFLIVMAFSSDVAAYYVGRFMGRRKLLPSVSAGKTEEGAAAGIIGCMIACVIFAVLFLPGTGTGHAAAMGVLGSIFGQLGDLSESAVKRTFNVKDSGFLIPGHGGILDRLDSFIFMAPFVYYYKHFFLVT